MKRLAKSTPKHVPMNQNETIIHHLLQHGTITQLEAMGVHRIFNLKGRIEELRNPLKKGSLVPAGKFINTRMKRDVTGKSYAEYYLDDINTNRRMA